MNIKDKVKIRVEHWLEHNERHYEEYLNFVKELEEQGLEKEKEVIKKVADLTKQISSLFKEIL